MRNEIQPLPVKEPIHLDKVIEEARAKKTIDLRNKKLKMDEDGNLTKLEKKQGKAELTKVKPVQVNEAEPKDMNFDTMSFNQRQALRKLYDRVLDKKKKKKFKKETTTKE